MKASGGTKMLPAIRAAFERPRTDDRVRIICFMTDGYVGNDFEIIDAVLQHSANTRVFVFGVGNSVNRFLLNGMAQAGRGSVEYVTLRTEGKSAARRFHRRIAAPVLTDIEIDWGSFPVEEVFPKKIPDLFDHQPVMVHGRLDDATTNGVVTLRGRTADGPFERRIAIGAPEKPSNNPALPPLWARAKVQELLMQNYKAVKHGRWPDATRETVIRLGIEYRLLTRFTSFVAVEELVVTVAGQPTKVAVPVEIPDGVSYEGVFGHRQTASSKRSFGGASRRIASAARSPMVVASMSFLGGGGGGPAKPPKLHETLLALTRAKGHERAKPDVGLERVHVVDHKVDVMVYLRDLAPVTRAALKELGFVQTGESKAIRLLVGTIDVRKLEELAGLDVVIHIAPLGRG